MLGVRAVVLCRLLVACTDVTVGILDSGVCATVLAVAAFVSLRASSSPPICPPPASRSRFVPFPPLASPATPSPPARARPPARYRRHLFYRLDYFY